MKVNARTTLRTMAYTSYSYYYFCFNFELVQHGAEGQDLLSQSDFVFMNYLNLGRLTCQGVSSLVCAMTKTINQLIALGSVKVLGKVACAWDSKKNLLMNVSMSLPVLYQINLLYSIYPVGIYISVKHIFYHFILQFILYLSGTSQNTLAI